jgi:hypothetical protein
LTVQTRGHHQNHHRTPEQQHAERFARWSFGMLVAFALWTAAFIGLSGVVGEWLGAEVEGGEVAYIEAWLPWLAVSLLWVLPLVAGVVLGVKAVRAGAGQPGKAAVVLNTLILVLMVGPSLIDRLLHL